MARHRPKHKKNALGVPFLLDERLSVPVVLCVVVLLIPFFELGMVNACYPDMRNIYYYIRLICISTIVLLYLVRGEKDALTVSSIALCLVMLISTCINGGSLRFAFINEWVSMAAMALLVAWAFRVNFTSFLWAVMIFSTVLSAANVLSIVAFPEGTYATQYTPQGDHFLYGHRNAFYQFIFLSVGVSWLLDAWKGKRFSARTGAIFLLGLIQVGAAYSATTTIALALAVMLGFLVQFVPWRRVLNGLVLVGLYFGLFAAIVIFRINEVFAPVIEDVFQRSATLTGRTAIWDAVIQRMDSEHLLFGYGASGKTVIAGSGLEFPHPHNELLTYLNCGGIAGLACFVTVLVLVGWSLFKSRNVLVSGVLCSLVSAFLVVSLAESVLHPSLMLALAIAWYASKKIRGQAGRSRTEDR